MGKIDLRRVGSRMPIVALAATALLSAAAAVLVPIAALALAVTGAAAGLIALIEARGLGARADRTASEIEALSIRMLRVEGRLSDRDPPPGAGTMATAGESALLDTRLKDLAATVAVAGPDEAGAAIGAGLREPVERAADQPSLPLSAARPLPLRPVGAPRSAEPEQPAREPPVIPSLLPAREPATPSTASAGSAPAADRIAAIAEAFEGDRVEVYLQPVVSLPQRKTRFYEATARLHLPDGELLAPAEFIPALDRLGRRADLDRRVLAHAAAIARHLAERGSEVRVCAGLSDASLEAGILHVVARIADTAAPVAGRLILALPPGGWHGAGADTLRELHRKGVVLALAQAAELRLDAAALARRGIGYVTIGARSLLDPHAAERRDGDPGDLAVELARAGIGLVAAGVEREQEVAGLVDLAVPLAQGNAFAPPRPIRPEVMSRLPSGAADIGLAHSPEGRDRRAPRAVLRRVG